MTSFAYLTSFLMSSLIDLLFMKDIYCFIVWIIYIIIVCHPKFNLLFYDLLSNPLIFFVFLLSFYPYLMISFDHLTIILISALIDLLLIHVKDIYCFIIWIIYIIVAFHPKFNLSFYGLLNNLLITFFFPLSFYVFLYHLMPVITCLTKFLIS